MSWKLMRIPKCGSVGKLKCLLALTFDTQDAKRSPGTMSNKPEISKSISQGINSNTDGLESKFWVKYSYWAITLSQIGKNV